MWRLWIVLGNLHDRALPETQFYLTVQLLTAAWFYFDGYCSANCPFAPSFKDAVSFTIVHGLLVHTAFYDSTEAFCYLQSSAASRSFTLTHKNHTLVIQCHFTLIPPEGSINKSLMYLASEVGHNVKLASQTGSLGCGGVFGGVQTCWNLLLQEKSQDNPQRVIIGESFAALRNAHRELLNQKWFRGNGKWITCFNWSFRTW